MRSKAAIYAGYGGEMPKEMQPMRVLGKWRVVSLGGSGPVRAEEVRPALAVTVPTGAPDGIDYLSLDYPGLRRAQDDMERRFVVEHLRRSDWNVLRAAGTMGIKRTALHNRLKVLGIETKALKAEEGGERRA